MRWAHLCIPALLLSACSVPRNPPALPPAERPVQSASSLRPSAPASSAKSVVSSAVVSSLTTDAMSSSVSSSSVAAANLRPQAVQRTTDALLTLLPDTKRSAIVFYGLESTTWPDTCLGLTRSDMPCNPQPVPGFRVSLRVMDTTYVLRTTEDPTGIVLLENPEVLQRSTVPDKDKIDIRGYIDRIHNDGHNLRMYVTCQNYPDTRYNKAYIQIPAGTSLLKDGSAIPLEQLATGAYIEVDFIGPVADFQPVQATAGEIRLLDPPSDSDHSL